MTELLSELYDLRDSARERKAMDAMMQKEIEEDLPIIKEAIGTILTDLKQGKSKCRPTKKQPQRKPQKKKVAKKK